MATRSTLTRSIWRISLPLILVEATETLDHLIDTLFLARVGITELGAIAIADTLILLFLILPLSVVDGVQLVTARRVGERRPDAAGAAFNQGLQLVLVISLACMVALKLFSPVLAGWYVESHAVGEAVDGYVQIDAYSIPLAGMTFACSALLVSLGRTAALIPAIIAAALIDVLLNYLFIFGKLGFPELGMRGAALGSIGAELTAAVFLIAHVKRALPGYNLLRFQPLERRFVRLLGGLSAPIAARGFVEDFRWLAFFLIIERLGTESLAIANIVFTCYLVFWIPADGFAETAFSFVSRFVGRGRTHRIGEVLRGATGGALLVTAPFILIALVAPQWLVAVFAHEPDLVGQGNAGLRVVALAMLIAIPAQMWLTAVEGTGDTAAALGIELLLTLVMLLVAWLAASYLAWPLVLVWLSVPIMWLVCLAASFGWMKSGIWRRIEL